MRKTLSLLSSLFLLALPACGDNGGDTEDTVATTNPATTTMTNPTSGATDDMPTGGEALSCADYCTTIGTNCTAGNAQYFAGTDNGMTPCMNACASFELGVAGEMANNTLGCRTYHAGAAMGDPATHCEHAGPGGAGVCGNDCDGFCTIALATCASQFADMGACMTACASFTDDTAYNATVMSGNNLACRLYHLTAAANSAADATTHCPHIAADSPVCI